MSDQSPRASPSEAEAEGIGHWTPRGGLLAACLVIFNVLLIFLVYFYFWRMLQRKRGTSSSSTVDAASSSSASSSPSVSPRIRDRREFDRVVASLPIVAVVHPSSSCIDGTEEKNKIEECAVCIAEFADGDEARLLPGCGHRFHVECVNEWLQFHTTCPLCRVSVMVEPKSAVLDMNTTV